MKKVISIVMSAILLVSVFAVCAFAGGVDNTVFYSTPSDKRICPGTLLGEDAIIYSANTLKTVADEYWFLTKKDGTEVIYDGGLLDETFDGAQFCYAVEYTDNTVDKTAEAVLTVKHVPQGEMQYDFLNHYRICGECGRECDEGVHIMVDGQCSICGMEQPEGFKVTENVFEALMVIPFMDTILGVIGMIVSVIGGILGGGDIDISF